MLIPEQETTAKVHAHKSRKTNNPYVCLYLGNTRHLLTIAETFALANQLVDTAEKLAHN
ncbi:hypothetical protein CGERO_03860 [Corynebacterium gerontici]|uniref:Uncharacterized protein n=1 Tax=Corynebacterium gerontici TaxID=2079234 RepID=A0A3G6IZ75_9CORY|nr:hypothetical protein CGERO_03860 [Corynebacterium gerontici]